MFLQRNGVFCVKGEHLKRPTVLLMALDGGGAVVPEQLQARCPCSMQTAADADGTLNPGRVCLGSMCLMPSDRACCCKARTRMSRTSVSAAMPMFSAGSQEACMRPPNAPGRSGTGCMHDRVRGRSRFSRRRGAQHQTPRISCKCRLQFMCNRTAWRKAFARP